MADEMIAERYRLRRRLGMGGMSTVRLAFDSNLEREVAVKLLAEHLADDDNFVSRFRGEALAAARLVHPNIVQVFDFGLDDPTGQHYIVMEYVEGQSYAEILREHRRLPIDEARPILARACRGRDHAHRNGVVHRGVKPGNLLRAYDGVVKLADFGIAKATEQSSITQVGSVLGTAAYLAPEQARGEEAGPAADLYALGVVAYQLISGRLPYEATSLTELALKQQQETPAMLDTLVAAVGPELADAVAIALALDPRDRYESAREMGRSLADGASGIAPDGRRRPGSAAQETEATSLLARDRPLSEATRQRGASPTVVPRSPRRGPPREAAVAGPYPPARAARRGRGRGLLLTMLVLLVLAAGIAAAI